MLVRWVTGLAVVGAVLLGGIGAHLHAVERDVVQAAALDQGVGNYDGPWYVGGDLTSIALIQQAGTSLTLMNEQGRVANGSATINQIAANFGDGPIVGNLSADQRQINWANGTIWQRQALIGAAFLSGPNIAGIWYVGDAATQRALIVQPQGGTIQMMNEQGRVSPAIFSGPNTVVATAWEGGVSGTLSPDGNFIGWSNGTQWRR